MHVSASVKNIDFDCDVDLDFSVLDTSSTGSENTVLAREIWARDNQKLRKHIWSKEFKSPPSSCTALQCLIAHTILLTYL